MGDMDLLDVDDMHPTSPQKGGHQLLCALLSVHVLPLHVHTANLLLLQLKV